MHNEIHASMDPESRGLHSASADWIKTAATEQSLKEIQDDRKAAGKDLTNAGQQAEINGQESKNKGLESIGVTPDGKAISTYTAGSRNDKLSTIIEGKNSDGSSEIKRTYFDGRPDGLKSDYQIKFDNRNGEVGREFADGTRFEMDKQNLMFTHVRTFDANGQVKTPVYEKAVGGADEPVGMEMKDADGVQKEITTKDSTFDASQQKKTGGTDNSGVKGKELKDVDGVPKEVTTKDSSFDSSKQTKDGAADNKSKQQNDSSGKMQNDSQGKAQNGTTGGDATGKQKDVGKDVNNGKEVKDRIEVAVTGSPEHGRRVQEALDRLPANVRRLLTEGGYKVYAPDRLTDIRPDLKNVKPRGYADGKTWDNTSSLHDENTKQVIVGDRYMHEGKLYHDDRPAENLRHEVGHALDVVIGKRMGLDKYTMSPEFLKAYNDDVAKIPPADRAKLEYMLQKDGAGASETFAEVFSQMHGNAATSDPETRRLIQKYFPNTERVIRARLAREN